MRSRNFFLSVQTYTGDGGLESFGGTTYEQQISTTNVVFQSVTAQHDTTDDNPSGNYKMFVSSRAVNDGSVTTQISKSAVSGSTTDSIDTITLVARG